MAIYTIGHSTHTQDEFIEILKAYDIELLVDVRSLPGSNYVPHFNQDNMKKWLKESGIVYQHAIDLGGRRNKQKEIDYQLVEGWRNTSFKNYVAFTLSTNYRNALSQLEKETKNLVLMCSEAEPWRCHRLLIANNLVKDKIDVSHIMSKTKTLE